MDENVTMCHAPDTTRLRLAFFAEDDIGVLVRCHYEAERAADHVLESLTNGRYCAKKPRYRYLSQKLEVLELFGVKRELLQAFHELNNLRNSLAHRGIEEITQLDLDKIFASINPLFPKSLDEFEMKWRGHTTFDAKYTELTTRQKYVVCVMSSIGIVSSIPEMVKQAPTPI